MTMKCKNCGNDELKEVLTDEYGGHKAAGSRQDTKKEVYRCESCGAEGKRFIDGVDGSVTLSGALRA